MQEGEEGRGTLLCESHLQEPGTAGFREMRGRTETQSRSVCQGSPKGLLLSLHPRFLRVPTVRSQSQQSQSRLQALGWERAV